MRLSPMTYFVRSFASIALTLLLTAACAPDRDDGGRGMVTLDPENADPVPVDVVELENGAIEAALRFSTNYEAETQVQVVARGAGQVVSLRVEEGDEVKAGKVLLQIENADPLSTLRRVKTDLEQAEKNLAVQKKLYAEGVVSDQILQEAQFEVRRLRIARGDASRTLGRTTVRSAIDGTVTLRNVKRGSYVTPGQPLFEVTDFASIVAKVYVPEKDLASVALGQRARIYDPSSGAQIKTAKVIRIAPIVSAQTGTVKITLQPDDIDGIRPGAFVDIELIIEARDNALLVPRKALVYDNDQPYVFKLDGNRVRRIAITSQIEGRDYLSPRGGLVTGDRIVVAGQVGLKDNALVQPRQAVDSDTSPASTRAAPDSKRP